MLVAVLFVVHEIDPVGFPPSHDVAREKHESLLVVVCEVTNTSNDDASLLPLLRPHSFPNRSPSYSTESVFLSKSNDNGREAAEPRRNLLHQRTCLVAARRSWAAQGLSSGCHGTVFLHCMRSNIGPHQLTGCVF